MLLVVDVGNTNIVLGVYKKNKMIKCSELGAGPVALFCFEGK